MIAGVIVFVIGLGLYIANLSYSLGDLSGRTLAMLVMGLGVVIFIIDLIRSLGRNRTRRARTVSRVTPDGQGGTVRDTRRDID